MKFPALRYKRGAVNFVKRSTLYIKITCLSGKTNGLVERKRFICLIHKVHRDACLPFSYYPATCYYFLKVVFATRQLLKNVWWSKDVPHVFIVHTQKNPALFNLEVQNKFFLTFNTFSAKG